MGLVISVLFTILVGYILFQRADDHAYSNGIKHRRYNYYKKTLLEQDFTISGKKYSAKILLHKKHFFFKMTQVLIGTPGALPEVLLDSNHKVSSLYSERHDDVKRFQFQSFEGDMDNYFRIFTPKKLKIEATQVLSPDVLIHFRDNFHQFDILITDGTIDMRKFGSVDIEKTMKDSEYLIKKIARFYKYSKVQTLIDSVVNKLER